MKVLKNNYRKDAHKKASNEYPREMVCENCKSELQYEKSDIVIEEFGCAKVICPCCGYKNYLNNGENDLTLTRRNVEFPTHFYRTSVETGAVDCCKNDTIKRYVSYAIDYFRRHKDERTWYACCGNLYIRVSRYENDKDYWVVVSNDYYETDIPFEPEDY